jgi:hypothetical protein
LHETGEHCKKLEIHSFEGAKLLTYFVAEEDLRKTAGALRIAVVELYRKKYVTFTS